MEKTEKQQTFGFLLKMIQEELREARKLAEELRFMLKGGESAYHDWS